VTDTEMTFLAAACAEVKGGGLLARAYLHSEFSVLNTRCLPIRDYRGLPRRNIEKSEGLVLHPNGAG